MSIAQSPLVSGDNGVLQKRSLKIVKKRVVAKATLYGFVYWYDTKSKKRTNKKEKRWQK